jgi:endonuclease-3
MAVKLTRGEMFDGTDEHVPRVTHRWGYLRTTKAENAMAELEERLKPEQFAELNALLVPFGKYTCTESEPHCSKCPLAGICKRVGVTESR